MEQFAKHLPIAELIAETDAYMVSLGYTTSTLRHHRQAWNALKNLAFAKGEVYFTKSLGFELLKDHYKVDPYASKLSEYKAVVRRSVMLLLEYQISGSIAKRIPKSDGTFPDQYVEIGEKFLTYLYKHKSLKTGTLNNYRKILRYLFNFLVAYEVNDICDVNIQYINTYLKTFAGCSRSYIDNATRVIAHFFEYTLKEGYTSTKFDFPEISVYKNRKIPEYYSAEEIGQILKAVDRANARGKRDYAMLLLGARYGLRISDIKALELSNIDFINNRISIVQQKTEKPITLDLLPDVGWAIIDYLKNGRPQSELSTIFLRHTVPHIPFTKTDNVAYIIGKYAQAAGITKRKSGRASFHMLRYSLASDLLEQNIPITTISSILGHSTLNVTTTYTQLDVPQLKACALEVPL
jgi:Site-specific recombinase XerD